MKKLDKLENEFLPQVMVDTTDIIFDVLRFLESSSKELIIANTGQVRIKKKRGRCIRNLLSFFIFLN